MSELPEMKNIVKTLAQEETSGLSCPSCSEASLRAAYAEYNAILLVCPNCGYEYWTSAKVVNAS